MNRAFLFFISIFVLITSAWAGGGPYFQRGNKGQVKLVDSCRLIEARFQEVNAWTQVVEGKSCSTVPPVREDGEGMCQMNVHSCLPEHVQKYQGLSSEVGGPNCWNLALVMGKVVPFMRQSSDEEWDFFLRSPLCRELQPGEKKQPGDFGSLEVRTPEGRTRHEHGFVYVSDSMVYAKNGVLTKDAYSLQSAEENAKRYPAGVLSGECLSDCGKAPLSWFMTADDRKAHDYQPVELDPDICNYLDGSKRPREIVEAVRKACDRFRESRMTNEEACSKYCAASSEHFYRCQDFDSFYKQHAANPDMHELKTRVEELECEAEQVAMEGKVLTNTAYENAYDTLHALQAYLDRQDYDQASPETKFVLGALRVRLASAGDQLRNGGGDSDLRHRLGNKFESTLKFWRDKLQ